MSEAARASQPSPDRDRDAERAQRILAPNAQETARAFAVDCARMMAEDRCEDVIVLDLRGISSVCDFFCIATGTSDRQMRAVIDHIQVMAKARGERPFRTDGYEEGAWIVADYIDVVIHLFDGEHRAYYDLESLWGDARQVEWGQTQGS